MSDKKPTYKEINGTTRVGDFLRTIGGVAPEILDVAGKITGIGGLTVLADKIKGSDSISAEDKEIALKELEFDIVDAQELTKRWASDNNSEEWLPKNIRPLVVANFTLLIDIVIISSMWGKPLGESYLPLLLTMGMTTIGGYFTLREFGKTSKLKNK